MNGDWTAVIGISVAVMAVVQVVSMVALAIGLRRMDASVRRIEQRVQTAVDEVRPAVTAALDEARTAAATTRTLVGDVNARLEAVDDAARAARLRMHKLADAAEWAATRLPVPMKVSGPAAMAAWAGVRAVRALADRTRLRRLERRRDAALAEAEGHIGIG